MPQRNDSQDSLPDVLRSSNRPIIIYQGGPPSYVDAPTSNALGLLFWLALLTLCLSIAGGFAWALWNPNYDQSRFSPIYAEGRPIGLLKQIEERKEVIAWSDRLIEFRDNMRILNEARRVASLTHPLLTDRQGIDTGHQGIDALRQQWDTMCANTRARIYDRRVGALDAQGRTLRRQLSHTIDPEEIRRIQAQLQALALQRASVLESRRTDSDPALHCTPAVQADVCLTDDDHEWCNPDIRHREEFPDEGQ